jgi:hypothetical protein
MAMNKPEQSIASQQIIGQQFGKHSTVATDSRGIRWTVQGGDDYSVRLELQSASVYSLQSTTRSSQEVHDKEFRRVQEPQTRLSFVCCKVIKRIIVVTTGNVH